MQLLQISSLPSQAVSGKGQLNLYSQSFGAGDYPYINFVKAGTSFKTGSVVDNAAVCYAQYLDQDGYSTDLHQACLFGGFQIPPSYSGQWTIRFNSLGAGKRIQINATIPSGSVTWTTISSNGCSFTNLQAATVYLDTSTTGIVDITFTMNGSAGNPTKIDLQSSGGFTNLVFCQTSELTLLDANEIFRREFLNEIRQLNPAWIRFMQPMGIEYSYNAGFDFENTITSMSWSTARIDPRIWAGDTTGTGTYSVTPPANYPGGFPTTKTQGTMIQIRITNAFSGPGTATLDVGGSWGAVDMTTYSVTNPSILANQVVTLVYDTELDRWNGTFNSAGMNSGMPLAVAVALCNKLNKNLWYNIPYMYTAASITSAIAYIRDNLNANLKCSVEWSNEVWNTIYPVYTYAIIGGAHFGIGGSDATKYNNWYGWKMSQVMPTVKSAWTSGGRRNLSDLICMFGVKVGVYDPTTINERLLGANLGAHAPAQYPILYCNGICDGMYMYGAQLLSVQPSYINGGTFASLAPLISAATSYAAGDTATAFAFCNTDIRSGTRDGVAGDSTLASFETIMDAWNGVAATYGVTLNMYEGGFQSVPPSAATLTTMGDGNAATDATNIANMLDAFKQDILFYNIIRDFYAYFAAESRVAAGGFPSWYVLCGLSGNNFSLYDGDIYSTKFQSWYAFRDYNDS